LRASTRDNLSLLPLTDTDFTGRRKVSGATVNRELALLKHMFHLAIDWDLYSDPNPLRKVKYFQEINTGFRVLKPDEETRLLRSATPAIQDIILYALNTGSRIGEIFSLRWQDVDLDQGMIDSFSHKTQKIRIVPVNAEVRRILEFWKLGRKNEYVFYNQKTGERFVDPDAGLELACKKAEIEGVTPCYQLAAGSKVQLYYGYENCRFHSRRRLQGGRAPGSQNQKIPQSPF
jgi:integrase